MKILHLIPSLGIGGTEKILLELCRGLDPGRFQHQVLAIKSGGPTADKIRSLGVPVEALGMPEGFLRGALGAKNLIDRLKMKLQEEKPRILHTWLTRSNVLGRLAGRAAGVPRIISSLRVMEAEKAYHLWAERWTEKYCDRVTVNCTALREFAIRKIGIAPQKIELIFNGIELPGPEPDGAAVESCRQLWLRPGEIAIGTVGRLHAQKGVDVFLRAARRVIDEYPHCRFLIPGDGPERGRLERLARRLRITHHVTFCGWVEKPAEFLALLDVFVLASRWEGMPNAVMEAMRAQKPVVATAVGGVPDLIEPGKEGLLVPAEDPRALANAILKFMRDAGFARSAGSAALLKLQTQFGMQRMIQAHEKLYQSLGA